MTATSDAALSTPSLISLPREIHSIIFSFFKLDREIRMSKKMCLTSSSMKRIYRGMMEKMRIVGRRKGGEGPMEGVEVLVSLLRQCQRLQEIVVRDPQVIQPLVFALETLFAASREDEEIRHEIRSLDISIPYRQPQPSIEDVQSIANLLASNQLPSLKKLVFDPCEGYFQRGAEEDALGRYIIQALKSNLPRLQVLDVRLGGGYTKEIAEVLEARFLGEGPSSSHDDGPVMGLRQLPDGWWYPLGGEDEEEEDVEQAAAIGRILEICLGTLGMLGGADHRLGGLALKLTGECVLARQLAMKEEQGEAAAPALSHLSIRNLSGEGQDAVSMMQALAMGSMPNLLVLDLEMVTINELIFQAIEQGYLIHVQELYLEDCEVTDEVLIALTESLRRGRRRGGRQGGMPYLVIFGLGHNEALGLNGLEALLSTALRGGMRDEDEEGGEAAAPRLGHLYLDHCRAVGGEGGIAILSQYLHPPPTTADDVELVRSLSSSPPSRLCGLNLNLCAIRGVEGIQPLSEVIQRHGCYHLVELFLSSNPLGDEGVISICEAFATSSSSSSASQQQQQQHQLQVLKLSNCSMGYRGMKALTDLLSTSVPHLQDLDLSQNPSIGKRGVTCFTKACASGAGRLILSSLLHLNLANVGMKGTTTELSLAQVIQQQGVFPRLQSLTLSMWNEKAKGMVVEALMREEEEGWGEEEERGGRRERCDVIFV